jgi:hypothetical protein
MWTSKTTTADEAKSLVAALRNISVAITDEAALHAWNEHEAGRLSDSQYFVVVRRLRVLAGEPTISQGT